MLLKVVRMPAPIANDGALAFAFIALAVAKLTQVVFPLANVEVTEGASVRHMLRWSVEVLPLGIPALGPAKLPVWLKVENVLV